MKFTSQLDLLGVMSICSVEAVAKFDSVSRALLLLLSDELGLEPRDFRLFKDNGNWTLKGSDFTVAVARSDAGAQVFCSREINKRTVTAALPSVSLFQTRQLASMFMSSSKAGFQQAFAFA